MLWRRPLEADRWRRHGWPSYCKSASRSAGCIFAKGGRRPEYRRSGSGEPTFHRRASSGRPFNLYSANSGSNSKRAEKESQKGGGRNVSAYRRSPFGVRDSKRLYRRIGVLSVSLFRSTDYASLDTSI